MRKERGEGGSGRDGASFVLGEEEDASLPPAFTVLPNAIEKSARAVIVHGLADFILIAEGTEIVIQNMTCKSFYI